MCHPSPPLPEAAPNMCFFRFPARGNAHSAAGESTASPNGANGICLFAGVPPRAVRRQGRTMRSYYLAVSTKLMSSFVGREGVHPLVFYISPILFLLPPTRPFHLTPPLLPFRSFRLSIFLLENPPYLHPFRPPPPVMTGH